MAPDNTSLSPPYVANIPSQHSPKSWLGSKAKDLARMSAEIVKPTGVAAAIPGAPPSSDEHHGSISQIPEIVEKGTMMTKVSDKGQKRVTFRIDPDEGDILYKSKKNGLGLSLYLFRYQL